jgi:hypothetical protein
VLECPEFSPKKDEEKRRRELKKMKFDEAEAQRTNPVHRVELEVLVETFRFSLSMPDCIVADACAEVIAEYPGRVFVITPPGRSM